jgi:1,4-alpha-glucan branching enzyme
MWAFPGKQLIFMGSELADEREWSEERGLNWGLRLDRPHAEMSQLVADLNRAYRPEPALWSQDTTPDGFRWIVGDDAHHNVFAFERWGLDGSVLVCVANFAAVPHEDYRLGLPRPGRWTELVNTDAASYGGSGVGNLGAVRAEEIAWHGRPASAAVRIPPLGVVWLRPDA